MKSPTDNWVMWNIRTFTKPCFTQHVIFLLAPLKLNRSDATVQLDSMIQLDGRGGKLRKMTGRTNQIFCPGKESFSNPIPSIFHRIPEQELQLQEDFQAQRQSHYPAAQLVRHWRWQLQYSFRRISDTIPTGYCLDVCATDSAECADARTEGSTALAQNWQVQQMAGATDGNRILWAHCLLIQQTPVLIISGWWFGTFYIFPYIGNNHPNWLIFFREVQTTNQQCSLFGYVVTSAVVLSRD